VNKFLAASCSPFVEQRGLQLSKLSLCVALLEEDDWCQFCRFIPYSLPYLDKQSAHIKDALVRAAIRSGNIANIEQLVANITSHEIIGLVIELGQLTVFEKIIASRESPDCHEMASSIITHSDSVQFLELLGSKDFLLSENIPGLDLKAQACMLGRIEILEWFLNGKPLDQSEWKSLVCLALNHSQVSVIKLLFELGRSLFTIEYLEKHTISVAKQAWRQRDYDIIRELEDFWEQLEDNEDVISQLQDILNK
jgi:hypothetical protein